jgi:serine O-acetyltransferase
MSSAHAAPGPQRGGPSAIASGVVASIIAAIDADPWRMPTADHPHPRKLATIVDRLRNALFPQTSIVAPRGAGELAAHVRGAIEQVRADLAGEIAAAFACVRGDAPADAARAADAEVDRFLLELSAIRAMLALDAQAAFDGDPAARSVDEVILCYPGFRAILVHRLAHALHRAGVPLIPRMMAEAVHSETGIDIHPGAEIGRGFFIDHGTGVVIGETTEIGEFCKIYQGVTLGAKSFERDEAGRIRKGYKRHPTLEDHVTVYAGATILGGDTVIGRGCVVAGGVFVTQSVPPNHVVAAPRVELRVREQRTGL